MKLRKEVSHLDGIASIMVALQYEHNPNGQICRISDTAEAYAAPNGNDILEIATSSQSISCVMYVSKRNIIVSPQAPSTLGAYRWVPLVVAC